MYLSSVASQGGGIHAGKESHPCIRVCREFSTWDNENLNPITIYRGIDFHLRSLGSKSSLWTRDAFALYALCLKKDSAGSETCAITLHFVAVGDVGIGLVRVSELKLRAYEALSY